MSKELEKAKFVHREKAIYQETAEKTLSDETGYRM
jgi:hypothetical protein